MSFNYTDLASLIAIIAGLLLTWKSLNARWLFFVLVFLQCLEIITHPFTINWTQHYYLWCVLLGSLLPLSLIFRNAIAYYLSETLDSDYFRSIQKSYQLTPLECAFIVIYLISAVFHFSVWLEIQLYMAHIIDNVFLYTYVWEGFQITAQCLEIMAMLTFIMTERKSMKRFEHEEAL
ncbi:hypothetical protein ACSLBF_13015 [Pseudoalteromonas sp. T1lg65]|uniref:hypothetical protein n=1 Tax=Pseudoalteromonas sp. T1lg65 TaxID=2077101 RepID=UPI003F79610E